MPRQQKDSNVGAWRQPFLEALEDTGAITIAAQRAGVHRSTVYEARDKDEDFRKALVEVQERCLERVEATAYQRARDGASDTAVIFWLKSRKPEVYGDRLRAEEVAQIKQQARREVIAEMQREIGELTPQARKLLMNAIPAA